MRHIRSVRFISHIVYLPVCLSTCLPGCPSVHLSVYLSVSACMCECICVRMCACVRVCMQVYMYACTYIHVYMLLWWCMHAYMCMCIPRCIKMEQGRIYFPHSLRTSKTDYLPLFCLQSQTWKCLLTDVVEDISLLFHHCRYIAVKSIICIFEARTQKFHSYRFD